MNLEWQAANLEGEIVNYNADQVQIQLVKYQQTELLTCEKIASLLRNFPLPEP